MAFKDIIPKWPGSLCDMAMGKMSEWLDEYKKALAVLETFGFTVGKFNVSMGVPPEIQTTIEGSIENIQVDGLTKMITAHQGEALLVSILKALILTRQIWERLELKVTGVTLNVTLGISPKIGVEVH
jgi:hypothetical protein